MARNTDIVVDDIHEARFLLDVDHFVFDIETDTSPPVGSAWEGKDKYGLSYCADVTHVSFYAGDEHPIVVFTLPVMEGSLKWDESEHGIAYFNELEKLEFLRQLFSRENYRAIGHNVVFDFRNLLGHLGFESLPHEVEVWDTLAMGQRVLFSEIGRSGLEFLTNKWGLNRRTVFYDNDKAFYEIMKKARKSFAVTPSLLLLQNVDTWLPYTDVTGSNLLKAAVGLAVQEYLGDIESDTDISKLSVEHMMLYESSHMSLDSWHQVINNCISYYVALDVVYTYRLYRLQVTWTNSLAQKNTQLRPAVGRPLHVPHWRQLPTLIKRDMAIARISANQAIRGVKLDSEFVHHSIQKYEDALVQEALPPFQDILQEDIDLYDHIATLRWYENIVQMLTLGRDGAKPTYSKPKVEGQVNHDLLEDEFLEAWFGDFPELLEWIRTLSEKATRSTIIKGLAQFSMTDEDIERLTVTTKDMIHSFLVMYGRPCSKVDDTPYIMLHFFYYEQWMRYICEKPQLTLLEYASKGKFKPYFVYTISQVDVPSEEDLMFNPKLTTDGYKNRLEHIQKNIWASGTDAPANKHGIAIEFEDFVRDDFTVDPTKVLMSHRGFSFGKDALTYYIETNLDKDDDLFQLEDIPNMKPLAILRIQLQLIAMISRSEEFLRHAMRDGRIHPILSRDTTTGRFSSKDPNVQNVKMDDKHGFHFSGYLVADDGYWLVECDYSNAENVMGAMISADNNFAEATEMGDFHSAQAQIYFPEKWAAAEGDAKERKRIRGSGKPITFGEAYGAGPTKLATMTKMTIEEVRQIIANKKAAYPKLYAKKKEAEDKCVGRYRDGYFPAYTVLWNGARVPVTIFENERPDGRIEYGGAYKCWNYVQQGGVSELVSGALIDIDDYLYRVGFETFVTLNVHDSLLPAVKLEEYDEVLPEIFKIMGSQVPQAYLDRTCPPTHFVSEAGPENRYKWGYRWNQEYPFPLDEFVNQWGVHKIPDGEDEAPTWRGPVHLGWSIEDDILRWQLENGQKQTGDTQSASNLTTFNRLKDSVEWLEENKDLIPQFLLLLEEIEQPRVITYTTGQGEVKETGPLASAEYISAARYLASQGVPDPTYSDYLASLELLQKMYNKLGEIL